jgi:NhaP-type Na+/H+ or K+/H+ antiporter
MALVFGSLISATDPVAVVAILRGTSSPKRLGILIEGESLLNDGTAIVVFGSLLALLQTQGAGLDVGDRILSFIWVVSGGVLVGVALASFLSALIARTFNDALVEITLTIVIAYGAMFIAEGLLHVSGVMAVVAAGLWMSGPGRTRISPEVGHFLHQFWEVVTYIANTLIFFLVGLVVAAQWPDAQLIDLAIIIAAFAGIMVIRFVVTFAFRPIVALVSDPIGPREAVVVSWGGLRGAVSLALALVVSQHSEIPEAYRQQVVLVTAGVVLLTIIVNGSTVAWLLDKLRLTERPLAMTVADLAVQASLLDEILGKLGDVSKEKDLAMVPWGKVDEEMSCRCTAIRKQLDSHSELLDEATSTERSLGRWQRALSIERRAYWKAFSDGTLGATAARILDREIARQLDAMTRGVDEPPQDRMPPEVKWRRQLARILPKWGYLAHVEFDRLALLYDIARAQTRAADKVLASIDRFSDQQGDVDVDIVRTYRRYHRKGKERVEELRSSLPEVAQAIETRLARRIQLNLEYSGYAELLEAGAIDSQTAEDAMDHVQRQMKELHRAPRKVAIPETAELVRAMPLFDSLSEDALEELAAITEEMVFAAGETLVTEGEIGDSMFVIARGAVHVAKDIDGRREVLDTLGGGEIIGEMSLLTGQPRTADVSAATMVTAGRIKKSDFDKMMSTRPKLREGIWHAFAAHEFDNLTRQDSRFAAMDHDARLAWMNAGNDTTELAPGTVLDTGDAAYVFIFVGEAQVGDSKYHAPCVLEIRPDEEFTAATELRAVLLPKRPN